MKTTIKTEFKSDYMTMQELGMWLSDLEFPDGSIKHSVYIGQDFNETPKFRAIVSCETEHA